MGDGVSSSNPKPVCPDQAAHVQAGFAKCACFVSICNVRIRKSKSKSPEVPDAL